MISELAGFTLRRTIPDNVITGVLTGAYKVCGGVVRSDSGRIVAHLVNATSPGSLLSAFSSPINAAISGFNTYQLHRVGLNVTRLLTLAKGTMFLSGLTLAASSAGFLFLSNKINKIDKEFHLIAKDLKFIRKFLELQERSRLISALKVIKNIDQLGCDSTRLQLLINSRQTLGEIHEKYKSILIEDKNAEETMLSEEYFTITAIGHSMCSAELNMFDQAARDLSDAQATWKKAAQSFVGEHVVKENPQRFLTQKYAKHIKTEEIVEWLGFTENSNRGLDRLDDLRSQTPRINVSNSINRQEVLAIEVARKLVERDKVLQGYVSQYKYYASTKQKPSAVQGYFSNLSKGEQINDCYMFVSNNLFLT